MEAISTPKEKFGIILPIALLTYCLILMDNSIVFTGSTEIGLALHLSASALTWVSNAYTLTFGSTLLLAGRLLDVYGRKKIFLVGLAIFGLTSLGDGLAINAATLIGMRALQGLGSAILAPTTLALMMDAYTGAMRAKAITYYGMTAGLGSTLGMIIGGALTTFVSWRLGFLINVPLTLMLAGLACKNVPAQTSQFAKVDYLGAILSVIGFGSIIYGLSAEQNQLWFIGAGVMVLGGFIFWEHQNAHPLLPLALFTNPTRCFAYLARLVFMMAMLSFWFLLPQTLHQVYGWDALQSGFAFVPVALTTFLGSLLSSRLLQVLAHRTLNIIGSVILVAGVGLMAGLGLTHGYWLDIAMPMVLIGLGQGLVMPALTSLGIYQAPTEMTGSASGVVNSVHQLGGPIGLAMITANATSMVSQYWWMTVFSVIVLLLAGLMPQEKK